MQSPIWSYQFAAASITGTLKIDLLDGQGQSIGPCAEAVLDTDGDTLQSLWGTPATFRAYSPQGSLIESDVPFFFRTGASYANGLQSPNIIDGSGPIFPAGKYLISGAARNGIIERVEEASGGVRTWDTEALSDSVGTAGELMTFAVSFPRQTGVYVKHCDSAGTLYVGPGLEAADLSSTFPGVDLGPGDWAEIKCGPGQSIAVKSSTGTIAYCAQRFSE